MKKMKMFTVVAMSMLFVATAHAKDPKPIQMPNEMSVAGAKLELNGKGTRKKFFFPVYEGALYLNKKSKNASEIIAADDAKAVSMNFLRTVPRAKLLEAFSEGFDANNSKEKVTAQKNNIDQMVVMLNHIEKVVEGQTLTFTYHPKSGTQMLLDGKLLGTIAGKEFQQALFAVWLGSNPPSEDLKKGMLGL